MTKETDFAEALQQIAEASGPFDRDPAQHARNCLRSMQRTAVLVLRKHGVAPRREDDVIDGELIEGNGHNSDCATHNEPAMPNGPCDCSLSR